MGGMRMFWIDSSLDIEGLRESRQIGGAYAARYLSGTSATWCKQWTAATGDLTKH